MIADGIVLEQTVIGHALNSKECYTLFVNELKWNYFAAQNHKIIAHCLIQMSKLGIRIPDEDSFQLTVGSYEGEGDKDYGGSEYIRLLKNSFLEKTENYQIFIEKMKLQATKNKIGSESIQKLLKLVNDSSSTAEQLRSEIRDIQQSVEEVSSSGYFFNDMKEISEMYQKNLAERPNRKFFTTGFPALDLNLSEGFAPKKISIIAGFTGMAKSTVVINMAHRIAVAGIESAIFSMESTSVSMVDKLVSTLTQIETTKLKKNAKDLTVEDHRNIRLALDSISNLPILINDQASLSIDNVHYQLQTAIRKGRKPSVVFIDLFGKIEDVDTGENLASRIQRECKRMRVLAKELDTHFSLVVQIGRQGFGKAKSGKIKRPTLIDIKNANAYAEEADLVLLLHRNKYYMKDLDEDILEINIAKQRDGESDIVTYFEMFANTSTIMDTEKKPYDYSSD